MHHAHGQEHLEPQLKLFQATNRYFVSSRHFAEQFSICKVFVIKQFPRHSATVATKSKQTIFNFPNCAIFQLSLRSATNKTYSFNSIATYAYIHLYTYYICISTCTLAASCYSLNALKCRFAMAATVLPTFFTEHLKKGNCCNILAVGRAKSCTATTSATFCLIYCRSFSKPKTKSVYSGEMLNYGECGKC